MTRDLPLPVRRLADDQARVSVALLDGHSRTGMVRTPAGAIVVALNTDSLRLSEFFSANWHPAPAGSAPHAIVTAFASPAQRYGLDHELDVARWWSPDRRELIVFDCDSYSVVKVCVRGVCSAVAPPDVVFVHGCALDLAVGESHRGILIMGSSGAGKTTLVASIRRQAGLRVAIVNDDWGPVHLTSGIAVSTGEPMLHMKALSVLAFRQTAPSQLAGCVSEGDGTRVLIPPESVFGAGGLADSVRLSNIIVLTRNGENHAKPNPPTAAIELLETGSYSQYYRAREPFLNGSLILLDEESRRRQRDLYTRLLSGVRVSWISNSGTKEDLVRAFLAAAGP